MPFTRTNWMNYSPPAINAANLLNMEDGIYYGLAHSGGIRNTAEFLDRNPASTTGGLAEAIADLGGSPGVVFAAPHNHPINGNYTVPATVHLVVSRGATFTVANGQTLTINGTVEAGNYQIFSWVGTGTVAGLSFINACWFGAIADSGVTDNAVAFAKAASSVGVNSTLWIPDKVGQSYHFSSGFVFGQHYAQLKCDGLLVYTGTAGAAVTLGIVGAFWTNMKAWLRLEKSALDWTETCTGVRLQGVWYSELHLGKVSKFTYGVELFGSGADHVYYNDIYLGEIHNNKIGLHFNGNSGGMNANDWYGGSFYDANLGGANYAGSYGINMPFDAVYRIEGNTFYSPKFEAHTAYKITNWIRCFGRFNAFVNPRGEDPCSDVMFRFGGDRNYVFGYALYSEINIYDETGGTTAIGGYGYKKFGPTVTFPNCEISFRTYKEGDRCVNSLYDEATDSPGQICVEAGTYWAPPIAVQVWTTNGNPVIVVQDGGADTIPVGTYIDIAGVANSPLKVIARDCKPPTQVANTITVDPAPANTVGPVVPVYHTPTLVDELPLSVEAWHLIGGGGEPAFENNWVNLGGAYETAAYMKDSFGFVHLRGMVKDGTGIPTTIFTLPVGYRSAAREHFAVPSNSLYGEAEVHNDGRVVAKVGSTTWFALNGITFSAA